MTIKMLGELCVIKSQNLSNLCIEHVQKHVQKHQIETVVSTLNTRNNYSNSRRTPSVLQKHTEVYNLKNVKGVCRIR